MVLSFIKIRVYSFSTMIAELGKVDDTVNILHIPHLILTFKIKTRYHFCLNFKNKGSEIKLF